MAPPPDVIRSRSHPIVKRFRALVERGDKDKAAALLEGPKLIEDALLSGVEIIEVAASQRIHRGSRSSRLIRELVARGHDVRLLHDETMDGLSPTEASQGILAIARRPTFSEDQLFADPPLVVVAVAMQNPGNLGALLRTADAASATGAVLTKGCADPFSWKALRGSMGSAFRLPHLSGRDLGDTIRMLKRRGVATVAATVDAPTRYDEVDLRRPCAFLFGSEGAGLDPAVVHAVDVQISIPVRSTVESLNVSVAAGIILFEAARQRRPR